MFRGVRYLTTLLLLPCVLAACASGAGILSSGVWQSGGLAHQHIHVLAVDPNNPQNIYGGDMQDGIFASIDGGLHWARSSVGLPPITDVYALAFDDAGKKLYAATGAGIYTSANAARSWMLLSSLPADTYTAIAFDPDSSQVIFIGTLQHGMLYSANSGVSWSNSSGNLPNTAINELVFDSSAHQLWAATNLGVYRSGNNGSSWQALNAGLPAGVSVNAVLPASVSGGTSRLVYAGTSQGFYLSQNDGAQWNTSQTALVKVHILALWLDLNSVTTLYIATDKAGVLRTTDNGQDWSSVATGLPLERPIFAITQGANGDQQLLAASNDVYLYPGTSSIFNPSSLLPFLLVVAFFYLLYRLNARGRKKSRDVLKPERIIEPGDQFEDQH